MPSKGVRPPGKCQERDPNALTPAEERFVLELLNGKSQTRAYMAAYPRSTATSAAANASRLIANDRVRRSLEEGRKRLVAEAIADATERRMLLTQIMRAKGKKNAVAVIKAIDVCNKMDGLYVKKVVGDLKHRGTVRVVHEHRPAPTS